MSLWRKNLRRVVCVTELSRFPFGHKRHRIAPAVIVLNRVVLELTVLVPFRGGGVGRPNRRH